MASNSNRRIQIPPQFLKPSNLERVTNEYWNISKDWNGLGKPSTVSTIISTTNHAMKAINPNTPIYSKLLKIQQDVVSMGKKRKPKKEAPQAKVVVL